MKYYHGSDELLVRVHFTVALILLELLCILELSRSEEKPFSTA